MPSLRERSSRPSYALMAGGLEGLSDEDGSAGPDAEGSSSARKRMVGGPGSPGSSDGSSDPGPARRMPKTTSKGKGKGKGKGKAKAVPADDSGSDFQAGSEEEEDDDDVEMDIDENEAEGKEGNDSDEDEDGDGLVELVDDEDGDDMMTGKKSGPGAWGRGSNTKAWTGPRSAQTAYIQTEANLVPPAYRALIKKYAEEISPPVRGSAGVANKDRTRTLEYDMLPFGPTTPFISRLRSRPGGRGVDEVYIVPRGEKDEDWEKRKPDRSLRSHEVLKSVTLIEPWQTWQGEGWWPEMAVPAGHSTADNVPSGSKAAGPSKTSQKHGKGKAADHTPATPPISTGNYEWRMREDVRLGLDHVGRYKYDQMNFLGATDAARYLPQTCLGLSNPSITVHMGQYGKQTKTQWQTFDSRPHNDLNDTLDGAVFCAGGPIWGVDWCPYPARDSAKHDGVQYLAVSPMPNLEYKPTVGSKEPRDAPGCIQIWGMVPALLDSAGKVKEPNRMKCELILCVEGGPSLEVKWMPMGTWDAEGDRSSVPKLGILAACQLDGTVTLYAVPHPRHLFNANGSPPGKPLFLKVEPLLKLEVADAACTTIEWINGSRIACGTSNGYVVAWDVVEALKNPSLSTPLPAIYICVAQSCVGSLAIGRVPTKDGEGSYDYTADPISMVAGCYDGTVQYIDLRDPDCVHNIIRTRMPIMGIGWSSQLAVPIWADAEHVVQLHNFNIVTSAPRSYYFAVHRGPIWSVSTSDYHTMVLSASADGSVTLTNLHSGWFRRRGAGITYQRLFEMDYDMHTGEYRMVDNFAVEDISLDYANQRNVNKSKSSTHSLEGNPIVIKTGNWSPHVGVHRSCWNNNGGLGKAGWIASGTASGLGRVDIVHGRFLHGQTPPGL